MVDRREQHPGQGPIHLGGNLRINLAGEVVDPLAQSLDQKTLDQKMALALRAFGEPFALPAQELFLKIANLSGGNKRERRDAEGELLRMATEGDTGWSTGPHLHFEVRVYGIPVNPRTFLGQGNPS